MHALRYYHYPLLTLPEVVITFFLEIIIFILSGSIFLNIEISIFILLMFSISIITFMKSFGIANLETNASITNESVFQLASLTKPFTALCIIKLVEQGKIDLKNPITKYIDSLSKEYELITVHHLLTHTAGFPDQVNLVYDNSPVMDISTEKQLLRHCLNLGKVISTVYRHI